MNCRIPMLACFALTIGAGSAALVAAEALKPPPGYFMAVHTKAGHSDACEAMPAPFTAKLDFPSKYEGSGKSRDAVNPEAEAAYKALTQPITSMEKGFSKLVGKYMDSGDSAQLNCAVQWIDGWASAHALEGDAANHTGRSLRKWSLASLSSAWLRLKFSSSAPLKNYATQAARVDAWLGDVASRVKAEWPATDRIDKINNHYYWAAWAMMATAVATDRRDLFDKALVLFRVFEHQVDAQGFLPNELARASRAAEYHSYAFLPLAMIGAFGKANGVDLASESDGALSRLAQRAQAALEDPASFEMKTGVKQDAPDADSKTNWSWLEPYCWTVKCPARLLARRVSLYPLGTTRLGGNLSEVFTGPFVGPKAPVVAEPR